MGLASSVLVVLLSGSCGTGPVPNSGPPLPSSSVAPSTPGATLPGTADHGSDLVDPPPGRGPARYTAQRLSWVDCLQGLVCATVLAPLEWDRPDGTAVTLRVSRRPAIRAPALGVLAVNPGGPGASGLDLPRSLPAGGLEHEDIVGWDPRGAGASTPVSCLDDAGYDRFFAVDTSPDDPAEVKLLERAERDRGLACRRHSGRLLSHVSTEDTARDLNLIRQLLGVDRLDYYGASYGTVIGALYAQLFPTHVDHFVLDGAVVLGDDEADLQTRGFAAGFAAFARWCGERACALGTSPTAVTATTSALLTRLDSAPLGVDGRTLTQSLAVEGIEQVLYGNQDSYPLLLRVLVAATAGNGVPLLAMADLANERSPDGRYGQINAAFPAIRCLDQAAAGVGAALNQYRRARSRIGGLGAFVGPDLTCPEWPVPARPYPRRIIAAQAPPILVVGTTGDPVTPYRSAEKLAAQLRSGRLLTFRGVGHTAYRQSGCVQQRVATFLTSGVLPPVGARC